MNSRNWTQRPKDRIVSDQTQIRHQTLSIDNDPGSGMSQTVQVW
jgi:hypothetical protein